MSRSTASGVVVFIAAIALSACSTPIEGGAGNLRAGVASETTGSEARSSLTPTAKPTATPTSTTPPVTLADHPMWSIPVGIDGWELTTIDQAGVNELTSADGCTFTSFQGGDLAPHPGDDRASSEALLESAFGQPAGSFADAPVVKIGTAPAVEFLFAELGYIEDHPVTARVAFRFDEASSVSLLLKYECPNDKFSEDQWTLLSSRSSVIGPTIRNF